MRRYVVMIIRHIVHWNVGIFYQSNRMNRRRIGVLKSIEHYPSFMTEQQERFAPYNEPEHEEFGGDCDNCWRWDTCIEKCEAYQRREHDTILA